MTPMTRLPRRAVVVSVDYLTTTGTVAIAFESVDGEPFDFEPGQFVAIDCHDPALGYRRSPYCVASRREQAPRFQLLVRRVETGPVSVFLAELDPEDVVGFGGPAGASMIANVQMDRDLVLLATGVGISPFLSLVPTLLEGEFRRPIELFWGLRLPEDICLTERLDALAGEHPNFRYEISLSRPPADGSWEGLRGRLTATVPRRLPRLANKQFFLSGNGAMIAEMTEALSAVGVSQSSVYEEYFFNARYRPGWDVVREIAGRFVAEDARNLFEHLRELLPEDSR